jgi:streptogramin lyase
MTGLTTMRPNSSAITSFVTGLGMLVSTGCTGAPERVVEPGAQLAIRGVVLNEGSGAPEAGVWVIAETHSLPTPFREIVVTEDEGRFVVPNLPDGSYEVWVRGYGLRDSMPVDALRGDELTLTVSTARSPQEAAAIYPASYWLSLYRPPAADELPDEFEGRAEWIANMKLGCMRCHQFGGRVFHARTRPEAWEDAWRHRSLEERTADWLGPDVFPRTLAAWAARIAEGEVPPAPPRPRGVERNVVVSQWEWGRRDSYIHDLISTDKRTPTLYPFGKVWGVDFGQDILWALDPRSHRVTSHAIPTTNVRPARPAPFPGAVVYHNPANPHVPTMDDSGKVWMAMQVRRERPEDQPPWARDVIVNVQRPETARDALGAWNTGSHHRQLGYFDTTTEEMVLVDTAYGTNHLQFDRDGRLWTSGDAVGVGRFDPSVFDPTAPEETLAAAQTAFVSVDPTSGESGAGGGYGIAVSPADGSVWRTNTYIGNSGSPDNSSFVGQNKIIKFAPDTSTFTDYELPPPARGPVGIDMTTDGRVWFGTASGHLGRFDPVTEQFTYWESPGPKLMGAESETGSADFHYYIFVDQFDAFGLGPDMVILTGSNSDALIIFDPATEQFTVVRVPYPLTMYHRGLDGRVDDAEAGWRGRGLWVNYGNDPVKHVETAIGYVNHIQLRPHPLAY